jgi:hypothetical protein
VLAAIGFGARRRSRIAGRAQQRIDDTLERLRRAGYVKFASDMIIGRWWRDETVEIDVLCAYVI